MQSSRGCKMFVHVMTVSQPIFLNLDWSVLPARNILFKMDQHGLLKYYYL